MDELEGNPLGNRLPGSIEEAELQKAVERSGYPLQTVVARMLTEKEWLVAEEASFLDPDTEASRTLDVRARRLLGELTEAESRRFYPSLELLIECKQSDFPYVFFRSDPFGPPVTFPRLQGVPQEFTLQGDDGKRVRYVPSLKALGGTDDPFVEQPPAFASSFAKAESAGSGKKLRLSGEDTYRALVEPILKATEHYAQGIGYERGGSALHCRVTVPIALLHAPMLLAETTTEQPKLRYAPWVRVLRHESPPSRPRRSWSERLLALDVVHRDYFLTYLTEHLEPFTDELMGRLGQHRDLFLDARAYVPGLSRGDPIPTELHKRLKPSSGPPG
jgi:hypothetical protein